MTVALGINRAGAVKARVAPALAFARISALDATTERFAAMDTVERHLTEAAEWLVRAREATGDGGVSYGFVLAGGWRPAYREVSGYIAETFFDLARALGRVDLERHGRELAQWLIGVQNADGSISNPRYEPNRGIVFDTGQVLHGYLRGYRETGDRALLSAAERAGDWLTRAADENGRWTRFVFSGTPHVYNTRTAWALLALDVVSPSSERARVARANLDWGVSRQRAGWFDNCGFEYGAPAFTHTIAYALRGLFESWRIAHEAPWLDATLEGAEALLPHVRADGFLPGSFDASGCPRARYACLTGNVQLALVYAKLFEVSGEARWRDAAARLVTYVARTQDTESLHPGVRGGIKGSQPVWGGYAPFSYPSWAAKFFADALMATGEWL